MKMTLLEMVQEILSSMDSDEVNSYDDTVESYQVALLVRRTFYDIATELGLPENETLFRLTASGDTALPCKMSLPSNVTDLRDINYDRRADGATNSDWYPVHYVSLDQFLQRQTGMKDTETNVLSMAIANRDGDTFNILCYNDRWPSCYTTFDDGTLIFDAYDVDIEDTLTNARTMCVGSTYSTYTLSDNFTPDLSPEQFSYFFNKAKTRAFLEIKQMENPEAVAETRAQKIRLQANKRVIKDQSQLNRTTRYGRK